MMARMHSPLTLPTEITSSAPDGVEALGWGALEGLETARPGLEFDVAWCERRRFKAKPGDSLVTRGEGGRVEVLLGFGPRDQLGTAALRKAAGTFASATGTAKTVALDLTGISELGVGAEQAAQVAIEGFWGARYRFTRYHAGDPDPLESLTIVLGEEEVSPGERGLERGRVIADATRLARDLINEPAGALTPAQLAEVAVETAERGGLEVTILDEEAIAKAGLGGLLGVAAGSVQAPRLIKLVYEPSPAQARKRPDGSIPTVALVGKGITFDSGGLSLKTPEGMLTMKTDMSGAADVIATMGACRALGVGVRVVGFAPTTENMPGGKATKPGDVLKIRNGKTIEVVNTDCEGRLVLADGLSLAVEERPDAIVDLATLTGACVVALGPRIAGLMGNDDRLIAALHAASQRAGEATWPLPLPEVYRADIDSEVADMKNQGKRGGGALTAALLLQEFVADRPWAHLDIAGPARSEEDQGEFRKGATGFGVRTLLEFLGSYEPLSSPATGAAGGKVVV
jgi:leucyl aminopeptidase